MGWDDTLGLLRLSTTSAPVLLYFEMGTQHTPQVQLLSISHPPPLQLLIRNQAAELSRECEGSRVNWIGSATVCNRQNQSQLLLPHGNVLTIVPFDHDDGSDCDGATSAVDLTPHLPVNYQNSLQVSTQGRAAHKNRAARKSRALGMHGLHWRCVLRAHTVQAECIVCCPACVSLQPTNGIVWHHGTTLPHEAVPDRV